MLHLCIKHIKETNTLIDINTEVCSKNYSTLVDQSISLLQKKRDNNISITDHYCVINVKLQKIQTEF